jgi:hypothetical protein
MDDDLRATGCPPWSRFEDVAGFDDDNGKKYRNVERVSALESVATTLDVVYLWPRIRHAPENFVLGQYRKSARGSTNRDHSSPCLSQRTRSKFN